MNVRQKFLRYQDHKSEFWIIFIIIGIKLMLHLIADFNSGYDGDEVLYIDMGKHLAPGYVESGPFIALLAAIQNLFHSHSLIVNHIFVHLASSVIIFLCGVIVLKLRGGKTAVTLALVSIAFAPALGISHNSFQPVIFDQLFWVWSFYLLISWSLSPEDKYLYQLGIMLALGFLSKYTMVFLIGGLVLSALFLNRQLFKKRALQVAMLLFIFLIMPNIIWQFRNDFPVVSHFKALYRMIAGENSIMNLGKFIIGFNPFLLPVWFSGLFIAPFVRRFSEIKVASVGMLLSVILLAAAGGRFYYFCPAAICGFCLGAVYLEEMLTKSRRLSVAYFTIIVLSACLLFPVGLPVFGLKSYVSILDLKEKPDGKIPLMLEARYTKDDWPALVSNVKNAYDKLSDEERKSALILGSDYTQTAVINFYRDQYGLPPAFSFHGSYYTWIPDFSKGITVIAIGNTHLPGQADIWYYNFSKLFNYVEHDSYLFCRYARDDKNTTFHVYICRDMKIDSEEYRRSHKNRIFE